MTDEKERTPHFDLPDWFSQHIPNWQKWLAPHVGQPLFALEIGSCEGRSALWLWENVLLKNPANFLECIDPFSASGSEASDMPGEVSAERLYENFKRNVGPCDSILHRKIDSFRLLVRALGSQSWTDEPFNEIYDIIYIDGSHMAVDVLEDIVLSWRLLKSGGTLILDDYEWGAHSGKILDTPRPAIDGFLAIYFGRYELLGIGVQVCVRKK